MRAQRGFSYDGLSVGRSAIDVARHIRYTLIPRTSQKDGAVSSSKCNALFRMCCMGRSYEHLSAEERGAIFAMKL
jgi:hypothetical protein